MRHRTGRTLVAAGLASLVLMAAPAAQAASPTSEGRAEWRGWLSDSAGGLRDGAERAIILGGALLYQNRHTVAGLTLGCLAGGAVGATGAVAGGCGDRRGRPAGDRAGRGAGLRPGRCGGWRDGPPARPADGVAATTLRRGTIAGTFSLPTKGERCRPSPIAARRTAHGAADPSRFRGAGRRSGAGPGARRRHARDRPRSGLPAPRHRQRGLRRRAGGRRSDRQRPAQQRPTMGADRRRRDGHGGSHRQGGGGAVRAGLATRGHRDDPRAFRPCRRP
ncbi:exported protein of unknown function (plasmid) [Azospirillum baldaniorum]|uniref:Glycine zipper domain-containing protein n=1 Tax=Azospirillum baldaniorum TaxID=1064539 RepID=A0A9P1K0Z5_9PROT|nr:exported protein of unknown function [Azospirillum baldaniorum]